MTKCPACGHEWVAYSSRPKYGHITKEVVMAAYERHKSLYLALDELGVKRGSQSLILNRLGLIGIGLTHRRPGITNEMIKAALDANSGNTAAASKALGTSTAFIYQRSNSDKTIREHMKHSHSSRRRFRSRLEFARAVVDANGNLSEVARIMGITRERVRQIQAREEADLKKQVECEILNPDPSPVVGFGRDSEEDIQ